MTDQDNLRDRLSDVIDRALSAWLTVDDALDGTAEGSEEDFVAQAIIDEFALTYEYRTVYSHDHPSGGNQKRIIGKWGAEE